MYRGDRNSIIGAVHVHALLCDPTWQRVSDRVQPVPRLRAGASLASAIVQVRRTRLRLAIIEDPSGRWLGIATLQDLFEEIVGDLGA